MATAGRIMAWFGTGTRKAQITAVNEFETYSGVNSNFDLGDVDTLIGTNFARKVNPTNYFLCAWPITFRVYMTDPSPDALAYMSAKLEYISGTNATTSTNWTEIASLSSNQFAPVVGTVGAHFGIVTWTPPNTNNQLYLVRIFAQIMSNGVLTVESGDRNVTNITASGDGATWEDEEILSIKSIPNQRPGM